MPKIKSFFECLIPESVCNLKCEYCYIIQRNQNKQKLSELDYSPEIIGRSLTQERLGGVCYFSICGLGETFVPDYLYDIIYQLLNNGHYVNVTTNGTLTKKIKRLENLPKDYLERLNISFSLHYLELKRLHLIDVFFNNIEFVRDLGCSVVIQLNLYDGYVPYLEEIKELCLKKIGAMPQIVATRKEEGLTKKIELMTDLSLEEYAKHAEMFDSPLFDFTIKNFNVKRKEFCYAGDWTFTLNLKTGVMKRCYASCIYQNIFENPEEPIRKLAMGKCCGSLYCLNSSHFMSLGVIPSVETPTYEELRNRRQAGWYNENMQNFLSGKLKYANEEYGIAKKTICNVVGFADNILYKMYSYAKQRKEK